MRVRGRGGQALVLALVIAGLFALIAQALASLAFNRTRLFRQTHILHSTRWAAAAAQRELASCLWTSTSTASLAGTSCPPSWSAWTCASGVCQTSRAMTYNVLGSSVAAQAVTVNATYDGSQLSVNAVTP